MLILPQKVEVSWYPANKEWYESKGYIFSKWHENFIVDVLDLPNKSGVQVKAKCDFCGEVKDIKYYYITKQNNYYCCNTCKNIKSGKTRTRYTIEFIQKEFQKRNYILLSKQYKGYTEYLEYICDKGHDCKITWKNFLKGRGCKPCAMEALFNYKRRNIDEVQNIFSEQGCTLLSSNYKDNHQKLDYICICGNKSKVSLLKFMSGQRCHDCSGSSKGELRIKSILEKHNIKFLSQFKFEDCKGSKYPLAFDFAVLEKDTLKFLIEFDGIQHFEPVKYFGGEKAFINTLKHDEIKNKHCLKKNIMLLRIPYWEYDNIEKILEEILQIEVNPSILFYPKGGCSWQLQVQQILF